jgi:hypothetical protein
MSITDKDHNKLINLVNNSFNRLGVAREGLLNFYEDNKSKINAEVLIVRSKDDEGYAAYKRNHAERALFVFSIEYWLISYFSGTCKRLEVPKSIRCRLENIE